MRFHLRAPSDEELDQMASVINAAFDDWRKLERVNVYVPEDPPRVDGQQIRRAAERGDICLEDSALAIVEDTVVGTVAIGFNSGEVARFRWLAVVPEYRRRGIATALLNHVLERAAARECQAIATASHVDSRYAPAINFLEANGMQWVDPDRCSITMKMDITRWRRQEPTLPEGYALRTWRDGDEEPWAQIRAAVFGGTPRPEFWRATFGSRPDFDPNGWFICMHRDEPVGIAAAVLTRYPDGRIMGCCIEWVAVLPAHRGKGLGRALITACLNYAAEFRPYPMVLVTELWRKEAVNLYRSVGFEIVREMRRYSKQL